MSPGVIHDLLVPGDEPALISSQTTLSYSQLCERVHSVAKFLEQAGIHKEDRIAIYSPNSCEAVIAILALWQLRAVACILNTRLPHASLDRQMRILDCRYCLSACSQIDISCPVVSLEGVVQRRLQKSPKEPVRVGMNDEATVLFTSGSTADAKPALHSFANHIYSALGSNDHIPLGPGDRWLLCLPLYHVAGLSILFRVFAAQAAVIVGDEQKPLERNVLDPGLTHVSLVTTQFEKLLNDKKSARALARFQAVLLGGSAVSHSLIDRAVEHRLPLYVSYGSTEMASQIATSDPVSSHAKPVKLRVLKFREVRIGDDHEIQVRGETRFLGYVKGQKIRQPFRRGGWFGTGDRGRLDNGNRLTVIGRMDNMFVSGGENVYPEEIESILGRIKEIEQAVVVPVPDETFGQRPVAFIRPHAHGRVNAQKLKDVLLEHLPKYKLPVQVFYFPERTNPDTHKHSRKGLTAIARRERGALRTLQGWSSS